jgi:hypothetical protein
MTVAPRNNGQRVKEIQPFKCMYHSVDTGCGDYNGQRVQEIQPFKCIYHSVDTGCGDFCVCT